jgi:hypothetical protein
VPVVSGVKHLNLLGSSVDYSPSLDTTMCDNVFIIAIFIGVPLVAGFKPLNIGSLVYHSTFIEFSLGASGVWSQALEPVDYFPSLDTTMCDVFFIIAIFIGCQWWLESST